MKVVIKDKRSNPRVIFIDGKRYILPSNKPVIKSISRAAYQQLKSNVWFEVSEVEDSSTQSEQAPETQSSPKAQETLPEQKVEENNPVQADVVTDPTVQNWVEVIEEGNNETVTVSEEQNVVDKKDQVEDIPEKKLSHADYASMSKKELKAMLIERGVDTTGMSKATMVDLLSHN